MSGHLRKPASLRKPAREQGRNATTDQSRFSTVSAHTLDIALAKIAIVTPIKFYLNGEPREVPDRTDLSRMITLFSLPERRVAIELNGDVIRRAQWPFTLIAPEDKVEVVHFVGGG